MSQQRHRIASSSEEKAFKRAAPSLERFMMQAPEKRLERRLRGDDGPRGTAELEKPGPARGEEPRGRDAAFRSLEADDEQLAGAGREAPRLRCEAFCSHRRQTQLAAPTVDVREVAPRVAGQGDDGDLGVARAEAGDPHARCGFRLPALRHRPSHAQRRGRGRDGIILFWNAIYGYVVALGASRYQ